MKKVHVVVPDLFLPSSLAKEVCANLALPVLEKILARCTSQRLAINSLEAWLRHSFEVPAIAPVTLLADGLAPETGYWLRADMVLLNLNRSQVILQTNVTLDLTEAQQLCASINEYFFDMGMRFFAPHPTRWYLRLDNEPDLITHSLYQVEGRDSRGYLPQGSSSLKWHGVLNEVQMLLNGHPLIQAATERGVAAPNSIWLWGGGRATKVSQPYDKIYGDSELAQLFAQAANIPCSRNFPSDVGVERELYIWEGMSVALRRGDFYAWRESALEFEKSCLNPLLQKLIAGELDQLTLDVLTDDVSRRFSLTRPMLWKFWRRVKPLAHYVSV
ncbi:MAG: hypothetical protein Q8O24_00905 [Gallionellaceae bacterium]|nr:hypothetical protein [Gallionellaceae bacterium]